MGVKEISENPLTKRVTAVFDKNKNGTVSFIEFLIGLARLASTADKEEKLRFAFEVYDVNRDGYISNGDLFSVMQAMVGDNLTEEQLQQLVDREMRDLDKDKARGVVLLLRRVGEPSKGRFRRENSGLSKCFEPSRIRRSLQEFFRKGLRLSRKTEWLVEIGLVEVGGGVADRQAGGGRQAGKQPDPLLPL